MEKEGFSITNVDIIGKSPCCDVKLIMEGSLIFQKEKVSFDELRELMQQIKINCDSIYKQLDSFKSNNKKERWI